MLRIMRVPSWWVIAGLLGGCCGPAVEAGELFYGQAGGIWRSTTDGADARFVTPAFDVRGLTLAGDELLWSDVEPRVPIQPTGVIRAVELSSGKRRDVALNLPAPVGIDIDAATQMVYWGDGEQHTILRTALDGSSDAETVFAGLMSVTSIHDVAIDAQSQKIYFGYVNPLIDSLFPGAIARMNLDGSNLETIVAGQSEPWGVAVDSTTGQVYWTDVLLGRGGVVRRANLDGSDPEFVVEGLAEPRGIAIDPAAQQLYWVDAAKNRIQRADTSGADVVELLSDLKQPLALAVLSALPGDINGNGMLDIADIDALTTEAAAGTHGPQFDFNTDGAVDKSDIQIWVEDYKHTWIGDVDLDGEFSSNDLVLVFQAGEYEDPVALNSVWSRGDWNGDGECDSNDLIWSFQAGGYEQGVRAAAAAIPEPSAGLLLWSALCASGIWWRRFKVGQSL